MSHFGLAPHLSFGLVGDRAVFLDLRRDRYFMLEPRSAEAFDRLRTGKARAGPEAAPLSRLVDIGLIMPAGAAKAIEPAAAPAPRTSAADIDAGSAGLVLFDAAEIGWRLRRVRKTLDRVPFEQIVTRLRHRRAHGAASAETLAARFMRARRLIPVAPDCLWDSLALSGFLAGRGASADLVFGVKLDPFAAHCWMQAGDIVLNDAVDTVCVFSPVLVA